MESMPAEWTDKRLDDLNQRVASGFDRVDADIRGLRVETRTEFIALRGEMKAGFDRVDGRFERISERLEALHCLMIQSAAVLLAALVGLHFV
jgi:hypothetical protein